MSGLQSTFYLLDLLGLAVLATAVGLVSMQATCPPTPRMRIDRRRR